MQPSIDMKDLPNKNFHKICVVGGGITGAMMVLLLKKSNLFKLNEIGWIKPDLKSQNDLRTTFFNKTSLDLLDNLDEVIMNMSEPMFSQDSSAFYILSKKVSEKTKVVLSGQGADEVFGGYFWYRKIMNEKTSTDIDKLSKYYFDRTFNSYSSAISTEFVTW